MKQPKYDRIEVREDEVDKKGTETAKEHSSSWCPFWFGNILLEKDPLQKRYHPQNVVDAQFSVPWGVATALLKRKVFIEDFTEEVIHRLDKTVY